MNTQIDSLTATSKVLTLSDQFTLEMWVRFSEVKISRSYNLVQKVQTYGKDTTMFRVYFTTEHSLNVDLNQTNVLSLKDAYDGPALVGAWTYVGVSLAHLFDTT